MQSGKKIDQKIELLLPSQFSSFDFLQQHKIITSTMHKESNNQPLLTFHKLHEDDSTSAFESGNATLHLLIQLQGKSCEIGM